MGGYEAGEGIGLRDKKKNDLKLMTAVVGWWLYGSSLFAI